MFLHNINLNDIIYYIDMCKMNGHQQKLSITLRHRFPIHPFDNYVIWPGSLALMNREPITLRNLLMRARLQDQKVCVT
jgi:hypothetical protein